MKPDSLENEFIRMSKPEVINYLRQEGMLLKEMKCDKCGCFLHEEKSESFLDKVCFRCYNSKCLAYKKRTSIRKSSFFEDLFCEFFIVVKVLVGFSCDQPRHSITKKGTVSPSLYDKIIKKILAKIIEISKKEEKYGGPGVIVQADETMLNYKCKSHRGRSATNKTDALCIVEVNGHITRGFSTTIPNKEANTIIPIICSKVVNGSTIFTDEHRSYGSLVSKGFVHKTVCHKYNFVDRVTGAHTQFVESFNNELKLEIKRRKGIETNLRETFLKEFNWKFNNKINRLEKIMKMLRL